MPCPAAIRCAEALVRVHLDAVVIAGAETATSDNIRTPAGARNYPEYVASAIARAQPLLREMASSLVEAHEPRAGQWVLSVAGVALPGPETPREADVRRGRLVAALAVAIQHAWNGDALDVEFDGPTAEERVRQRLHAFGSKLRETARAAEDGRSRGLREAAALFENEFGTSCQYADQEVHACTEPAAFTTTFRHRTEEREETRRRCIRHRVDTSWFWAPVRSVVIEEG